MFVCGSVVLDHNLCRRLLEEVLGYKGERRISRWIRIYPLASSGLGFGRVFPVQVGIVVVFWGGFVRYGIILKIVG